MQMREKVGKSQFTVFLPMICGSGGSKSRLAVAHFEVRSGKKLMSSEHFWAFGCRFAWQAQGILHLAKSEQNVRVL
jgi:hypothetical protein